MTLRPGAISGADTPRVSTTETGNGPRHHHRSKSTALQHLSTDEVASAIARRACDRPDCAHYAACLGAVARRRPEPRNVCPGECTRYEAIDADRSAVARLRSVVGV